MPISRPLLLALLAALLAMATFYAATGAQRASSEPETASFTPEPAAEPGSASKAPKPEPAPSQRGARQQAKPRQGAKDKQPVADRSEARSQPAERDRRPDARRRAQRARAALPPELRVDGLPRPVARALAAKRRIVLVFRQGAADDSVTAAARAGTRGIRDVTLFSAPIQRLGRYSAVISGLGVAQAPAIAIVGRDRQAQLVEGFVDAGTLRQLVLDAR